MTDLIGRPKGIPFLRVQAGGPVVVQFIERPIDIEALASSFIARGGRYLVCEMQDGTVTIGAVVKRLDDESYRIVPDVNVMQLMLPHEIDKMVRESVRKLDEVQ